MSTEHEQDTAAQIDQALVGLLSLLWEAAQNSQDKPWSLAKLRKRSGVYMSTLLRHLNALVSAGLVELIAREDGTGSAALSSAGCDLCTVIFSQPPTSVMHTVG